MKMLLLLGAFFAVLLNPTDVLRNGVSLASEVPADVFAVLQPGTNEIKFEYEGRARRLLKDKDRTVNGTFASISPVWNNR